MVKKQSGKKGNFKDQKGGFKKAKVQEKDSFYQVASSDSEYNSDEIDEQQNEAKRLQQIRAQKLKNIQKREIKVAQDQIRLQEAAQKIKLDEPKIQEKRSLGNALFEEDEIETTQIQDLDQLKFHIIKLLKAADKQCNQTYVETKGQLLLCYATLVHYFNYLTGQKVSSSIKEEVIYKLAQIKTYLQQFSLIDSKFEKGQKQVGPQPNSAMSDNSDHDDSDEESQRGDLMQFNNAEDQEESGDEEEEESDDEEYQEIAQGKTEMGDLIQGMMMNDSDQEAVQELEHDLGQFNEDDYKIIKNKKINKQTKQKNDKQQINSEPQKQTGVIKDIKDEDLPDMFKQRLNDKKHAQVKHQEKKQKLKEIGLQDKDKMEKSILRKTNYEIEKNRGLIRKRNKKIKNPRVKHRIKYQKALVSRKSQGVVLSRKDTGKRYEGEMGLHTNYVKSVSLAK